MPTSIAQRVTPPVPAVAGASPSGITARVEVMTWDTCVIRVSVGSRAFVLCVTPEELDGWLARLAAGGLDNQLEGVARRPPRRTLKRLPRSVRRANHRRPPRVGVEHEFQVFGGEQPVDFRRLLPELFPGRPRLDPADPNATRLALGVVTADGWEAEIATVPVPMQAGFAHIAAATTGSLRADLDAELPDGHTLRGFSTHISVSWDTRSDRLHARQWARMFAPVLMLLLDRPTSPGLLVRPRPGRLELCGEYCSGERLEAAVAFAGASVRTLRRLLRNDIRRSSIDVALVPAVERFGWYVDRAAFGDDLYRSGSLTTLWRAGRSISAAEHAAEMCALVRDDLIGIADLGDLAAFDRGVDDVMANRFFAHRVLTGDDES